MPWMDAQAWSTFNGRVSFQWLEHLHACLCCHVDHYSMNVAGNGTVSGTDDDLSGADAKTA